MPALHTTVLADLTSSGGGAAGAVVLILWLGILALMIAAMWKVFDKAGEPGWAALIPIYNLIVLLKIVGRPLWWIVLMLIPLVNFIAAIVLAVDTAKAFGKGGGFSLLLLFLPFIGYPILGFGDATYRGPVAQT